MRVGCESNNRNQKDVFKVFLKEVELRTQNMLNILGLIVNMIGGDLYDHVMSRRNFTLKIFI